MYYVAGDVLVKLEGGCYDNSCLADEKNEVQLGEVTYPMSLYGQQVKESAFKPKSNESLISQLFCKRSQDLPECKTLQQHRLNHRFPDLTLDTLNHLCDRAWESVFYQWPQVTLIRKSWRHWISSTHVHGTTTTKDSHLLLVKTNVFPSFIELSVGILGGQRRDTQLTERRSST